MKCMYCDNKAIKNGRQNTSKQRYFCKSCRKSFQNNYSYQAYQKNINDKLVKLLKEGCGVRSVARILDIANGTVLSRILFVAEKTEIPSFQEVGCEFEIDEVFIKIANGNSKNYLTYVLERKSKSIIGFHIGSKSKESLAPLINKVLLLQPKRIYTDKMGSYSSLIPEDIHRKFKYGTNRIERNHLTLRTHIKRLARKTICYSKKEKYLEAHLKIYFWC